MKKTTFFLVCFVLISVSLLAQTPQAFKYQAVARTSSGNLIQNQLVAFRISLLQGSPSGTLAYQERHTTNTNDYGLASLDIGNGTVLAGSFSSIDWSAGSMFIKVEFDPLGGTAYQNMGTSQLLSVPYALYSEHSANSPWLIGSTGIYYNDANVGIGTNNPTIKLEVNGTTLIGIETKGIRFRNDGAFTDIESLGTDLAINYQGGNTVLNGNAGNVGIGCLFPDYKFHVRSYASGTWLSEFYNTSTSSSGNGVVIRADGGDPLWIQNNLTTLLAVKNNGNVGIGTTTPEASLHVNGLGLFKSGDGGIYLGSNGTSGSVGYAGISGSFSNITLNNGKTTFYGNVGIGTSSPNRELEINGGNAENGLRVAWGPTYPTVYGEILHGGSGGFKLNAEAGGGGWADMSFQTNGTTRMFIESVGNIGIGTTAPTQLLDVNGNARFRAIGSGAYAGPVNRTSDGTLTTATSDGRLKENVHTLQNSLDKVMQLRGVSFTWKSNPEMGKRIGFIAQEFEKVIPELVFTNAQDGYKGINYAEVSAVLVEAIKELKMENDRLKTENDNLNNRLERIEEQLNLSTQR